DEIGELALPCQAKLLRAVELGEIRPVGSERALQVDVRIIAATNRDLRLAVREGRFRGDLLMRLAQVEIHVPPLRERIEDIRPLIQHFLSGRPGTRPALGRSALHILESYAWPYNVRELRNAIESA